MENDFVKCLVQCLHIKILNKQQLITWMIVKDGGSRGPQETERRRRRKSVSQTGNWSFVRLPRMLPALHFRETRKGRKSWGMAAHFPSWFWYCIVSEHEWTRPGSNWSAPGHGTGRAGSTFSQTFHLKAAEEEMPRVGVLSWALHLPTSYSKVQISAVKVSPNISECLACMRSWFYSTTS